MHVKSLNVCIGTLLMLLSPTRCLKWNNLHNTPCKQSGICECVFPHGYGVNLSDLSHLSYSFEDTKNNLTYTLRPCSDAQDVCHAPSSLCVADKTNKTFTILGTRNETSFSSTGAFEPVFLTMSHGQMSTQISLECTNGNETIFMLDEDGFKGNLNTISMSFILKSPHVCSQELSSVTDAGLNGGLSTGSILVILFLVFGSVYILGGSAANHILRGATGLEMIPNRSFWLDLPQLCMDGFKFLINGFHNPPSYEQI